MSLGKQIIERLRALNDAVADAQELIQDESGSQLMVAAEPIQARLEFFDRDRYSVTLRALQVGARAGAPSDDHSYLSATAAAIARQLSFLEEPLAVWELAGGEALAQLRSSPPLRDGDEVTYWEVALWAGEQPHARVARYRWAPGMAEREVVAYPATFALIGRMADALAAGLATGE